MTGVYDQSTGRWVERPNANVSAPAGLMRAGNTFVRGPVKSVAARTAEIGQTNSPLMQLARKGAQVGQAQRGMLNSTLALQAGEQAALSQAGQMALADAQLQAQADAQNAEALNAVQIAELQRQAASASSNSGSTGAQYNMLDSQIDHDRRIALMREQSLLDREGAREERDWRSGESERDRGLNREEWGWRSGESERDRGLTREEWGWRSGESERDRGFGREGWANDRDAAREERSWMRENLDSEQRYAMFRDMFGMMGQTLFSDPSFWRDQNGASGFLDFYTNQFAGIWGQFFGNRSGSGNGPGGG